MWAFWFILSVSSSFPTVYSLVHRATPEDYKDKAVLASYVKQGLCFDYLKVGYKNDEKTKAPCKTWCEVQHGDKLSSYAVCIALGIQPKIVAESFIGTVR